MIAIIASVYMMLSIDLQLKLLTHLFFAFDYLAFSANYRPGVVVTFISPTDFVMEARTLQQTMKQNILYSLVQKLLTRHERSMKYERSTAPTTVAIIDDHYHSPTTRSKVYEIIDQYTQLVLTILQISSYS